MKLRQINDRITTVQANNGNVDEYTAAHMADVQSRIEKALSTQYVIPR